MPSENARRILSRLEGQSMETKGLAVAVVAFLAGVGVMHAMSARAPVAADRSSSDTLVVQPAGAGAEASR